MNKPYFERMLADRIRRNLKEHRRGERQTQGWADLYQVRKNTDPDTIIKGDDKGFWVDSVSKAIEAQPELNAIGDAAAGYMMELIESAGSRHLKSQPSVLTSPSL